MNHLIRPQTIVQPRTGRKFVIGKDLSGGVFVQIDGLPRMLFAPEEAFKFAKAIFEGLGIEMEYEHKLQ